MKKTVISVLIVLLLSFAVLGCPTGPCEVCGEEPCICKTADKSNLTQAVINDLPTGISASDVLTPLGTTLHAHKKGGMNNIVILWKDANQAMFDYYEKAWKANERAFIPINDYSAFDNANIEFFAEEGELKDWGLTYPAGTIYFFGQKN